MAAVAAYNDQITGIFASKAVDFLARLPIGQLALALQKAVLRNKAVQAFTGLFDLLLLKGGKVHGHVTAERHSHWFDHVDQGNLALEAGSQIDSTTDYGMAFISQVDGYQNVFIRHFISPP